MAKKVQRGLGRGLGALLGEDVVAAAPAAAPEAEPARAADEGVHASDPHGGSQSGSATPQL